MHNSRYQLKIKYQKIFADIQKGFDENLYGSTKRSLHAKADFTTILSYYQNKIIYFIVSTEDQFYRNRLKNIIAALERLANQNHKEDIISDEKYTKFIASHSYTAATHINNLYNEIVELHNQESSSLWGKIKYDSLHKHEFKLFTSLLAPHLIFTKKLTYWQKFLGWLGFKKYSLANNANISTASTQSINVRLTETLIVYSQLQNLEPVGKNPKNKTIPSSTC